MAGDDSSGLLFASTGTCRVSHPLPSNVIPFYDNNTQLLPPATIIEGRALILECENDNSHVSWMCTSNGWSNQMLPDCNGE